MQCFLNIKISQPATDSEPTANTLLIKRNAKNKTTGTTTIRDKIQRTQNNFYIWITINSQGAIIISALIQNAINKQQCFHIIKLFCTKRISDFRCNQILTTFALISKMYAKYNISALFHKEHSFRNTAK